MEAVVRVFHIVKYRRSLSKRSFIV